MDENKIRQIIRQEIAQHNSGARFGLNSIQRHIHNNIDSPFTFQPIVTYVGVIAGVGVPVFLPKGWTVSGGVGVYTVTHNLGSSALYSVSATASSGSGSGLDVINAYATGNNVIFNVFDSISGTLDVCDFYFTLTVVNNKSLQLPTYEVTTFL